MSDVDNENAELPEQPRPAAAEPEPPVPAIEPEPARPRRVGLGLPMAALIVPVLAGCVLFFVTSEVPSWIISGGTVVVSALLLAIDARRLGNIDLKGKRREPATVCCGDRSDVGCRLPYSFAPGNVLVVDCRFPFTFFRRREFGGPNLVIPGDPGCPLLCWQSVPARNVDSGDVCRRATAAKPCNCSIGLCVRACREARFNPSMGTARSAMMRWRTAVAVNASCIPTREIS